MRQLDLVGLRFNMLLVIKKADPIRRHSAFLCKCDCGNERVVIGCLLKSRKVGCCGCSDGDAKRRVKYLNRQLYEIWKTMRARCRYKKHIGWPIYGGAGVRVCKEWDSSFIPFYEWCMKNKWKPGLQIDKDIIPKKLGIPPILYSPDMCSIVTRKQNIRASNHTKLTEEIVSEIKKSTISNRELAYNYSVNITTIYSVKNGKTWQ